MFLLETTVSSRELFPRLLDMTQTNALKLMIPYGPPLIATMMRRLLWKKGIYRMPQVSQPNSFIVVKSNGTSIKQNFNNPTIGQTSK